MKKRSTHKAFSHKAFSMGRQASFDWQVREDARQGEDETLVSLASPPRRRNWLLLGACFALVLAIGYWGGQHLIERAEANLEVVEAEVAEAILLENVQRPPNLAALGTEIADEWGDGVELIELTMDTALVDVVVSQPSETWHDEPYRVARVLRQDGKGWQLIEPAHSFWGDRRTLETSYLVINHSGRDAAAVNEIAAALDASFVQLHTDLAIGDPPRGERTKINIALVDGGQVRVTDLTYSGDTLIIPPPDLIARPLDMTNAEALRQAIVYALAASLFFETQEEFPTPCAWNAVAEGVGLWLRWEDHTLPSRRQWIYESMINEWRSPTSLPRLDDLLSFPLSCSRPPTILEAEILNSGRPMPRQELASTLIEYIVATYGRQVIPTLLHDLGQFESWETLAQKSFGVSAAELETGWQAYLVERER